MYAVSKSGIGSITRRTHALYLLCISLALQCGVSSRANADEKPKPNRVQVSLSEWKVSLRPKAVPSGPVMFEVTNSGKVPHALESEGSRVETSTSRRMPESAATRNMER